MIKRIGELFRIQREQFLDQIAIIIVRINSAIGRFNASGDGLLVWRQAGNRIEGIAGERQIDSVVIVIINRQIQQGRIAHLRCKSACQTIFTGDNHILVGL